MIKSASASRHKGGTRVYDGCKETKEHPFSDKKHHYSSEESHRKDRKNVLTEQRKEADDKSTEVHSSIQREKSERLSSRRREKTDVIQRTERDGGHAKSTEDGRRRSKLPSHDKLEQPLHQNAEKRSLKSQVFKLIWEGGVRIC